MWLPRGILVGFLLCAVLCAQGPPPPTAEVTTKEAPVTFRSGVNLVPVSVVVRDSRGHAVGNLSADDFQLFDNGKPQMISKFSVERLGTDASPDQPVRPAASGETLVDANPDGIPNRFVAYVFDDLHMSLPDLVYTRDAARRRIDSAPSAMERTAIYTISGKPMQDFTSDREKLHSAIAAINPTHAIATETFQHASCPPMSYYVADQIYNKGDKDALAIAAGKAIACAQLKPNQSDVAIGMAKQAAREAFFYGSLDTQASLETLRNLVSKMATMAGQRTIVLLSAGFLVPDERREEQTALIERAIRSNVVISALDARGLYYESGHVAYGVYTKMEDTIQGEEMATIAEGTGGAFFHNSNNYDEGISRSAAAPEYLYVLGFSPLDLKTDGKYHNLKVTLKNAKGMELQVRKGYYAPSYGASPEERAKQEIEEAFFSRDEVRDLPALLKTQYFKTGDTDATLAAVATVDVKKLPLRKEGGRNLDNLTVVTGLFDNDGNYVSGVQKTVELRLLDDTLEKRLGSGIAVKSSFAVHTGKYVVRMVVRDSEGQMMAEQSSQVEIQ